MVMRALIISAIVLVAVIMIVDAIIPAMAVIASGVIVSINNAEKHGVIERTGDGSGTLYQFSIPKDTDGRTVNVGQEVQFIVDPENSRHATNVGICVPPQCNF